MQKTRTRKGPPKCLSRFNRSEYEGDEGEDTEVAGSDTEDEGRNEEGAGSEDEADESGERGKDQACSSEGDDDDSAVTQQKGD